MATQKYTEINDCTAVMESLQGSETRRVATIATLRSHTDRLRRELHPEINSLNSKLLSRGLISEEIMAKMNIDETLSAIRRRLENETESTFSEFTYAVAEIASKAHLTSMLMASLNKELRECGEEAVFIGSPSISIRQGGGGTLVSGTATHSTPPVRQTITPASSLSPAGTWPEGSNKSARRDSAWNSTPSTDGEVPAMGQPTDEDFPGHPIVKPAASGTMPVQFNTQGSIELRNKELEERVSDLQDRLEQLELEKKESQKLLLVKTSDTEKTNRELCQTLTELHRKENEVHVLRERLDSLKGQHTNFQVVLLQRLEQQEDKTREYEESALHHSQQARMYRERYEQEVEKARQAEENAKELRKKNSVMEQNIKKMVTAISSRQKKMQEMESNLDSIESQTLETESEEDFSSIEGQLENELPYASLTEA